MSRQTVISRCTCIACLSAVSTGSSNSKQALCTHLCISRISPTLQNMFRGKEWTDDRRFSHPFNSISVISRRLVGDKKTVFHCFPKRGGIKRDMTGESENPNQPKTLTPSRPHAFTASTVGLFKLFGLLGTLTVTHHHRPTRSSPRKNRCRGCQNIS